MLKFIINEERGSYTDPHIRFKDYCRGYLVFSACNIKYTLFSKGDKHLKTELFYRPY